VVDIAMLMIVLSEAATPSPAAGAAVVPQGPLSTAADQFLSTGDALLTDVICCWWPAIKASCKQPDKLTTSTDANINKTKFCILQQTTKLVPAFLQQSKLVPTFLQQGKGLFLNSSGNKQSLFWNSSTNTPKVVPFGSCAGTPFGLFVLQQQLNKQPSTTAE